MRKEGLLREMNTEKGVDHVQSSNERGTGFASNKPKHDVVSVEASVQERLGFAVCGSICLHTGEI